eukprot:766154-Hanusia_phi.AAC.10
MGHEQIRDHARTCFTGVCPEISFFRNVSSSSLKKPKFIAVHSSPPPPLLSLLLSFLRPFALPQSILLVARMSVRFITPCPSDLYWQYQTTPPMYPTQPGMEDLPVAKKNRSNQSCPHQHSPLYLRGALERRRGGREGRGGEGKGGRRGKGEELSGDDIDGEGKSCEKIHAGKNCETPSMAPTKPTVGTRILEFDRSVRKGTGSVNVSVELWDVSGDRAYEAAWPAIMHGAMGVIYVYDAGNAGEEKDLDQWHRWFGMTLGFKDSQCLIMGHRKSLEASSSRKGVPKSLAQVHFVSTTLEENHDLIKEEFDRCGSLFLFWVRVGIDELAGFLFTSSLQRMR